jgi:polysaccharide export outer membrane protein
MRNRKLIGLVILFTFPWLSTKAQDASKKQGSEDPSTTTKDKGTNNRVGEEPVKAATDDPNYQIGPEDELNIEVWREPDITRAVPVRPDGKISLPLLNDVQAAGLTPMQLTTEITTRLKKFIADPQVTVIVTKVNSKRIYILGEVVRAGAYPFVPSMTVLEALSSAGGFTPFAKQSKIYVVRKEDGKEVRLPFNYKEVRSGQRTEQNITLKPGDTVVVP